MKVSARSAAAVVFVLSFIGIPFVAGASPVYLGVYGGGTMLDEPELIVGDTNPVSIDLDPGYTATLSLGWEVLHGRIELEASYRTTDIEDIETADMTEDPDSSITAKSAMLNSYADYDLQGPWSAHFMVGLGAAQVALDQGRNHDIDFSEEDDTLFAYQGGLGLSLELTRSFFFDTGYRYFGTLDPEFKTTDGEAIEMKYRSHNLNAGFRYNF